MRRWYQKVGVWGAIATGVVIFVPLLGVQLALWEHSKDPTAGMSAVEFFLSLFPSWPGFVLISFVTCWYCWVVPYFNSGDEKASFRIAPKARLKLNRSFVWLPGGMLLGYGTIGLAMLLFPALIDWYEFGRADLSTYELWIACILTVHGIAATLFAYYWSRLVTRRFKGTHFGTRRCLKCGYDLRGTATEAPCPECGHLESQPVES